MVVRFGQDGCRPDMYHWDMVWQYKGDKSWKNSPRNHSHALSTAYHHHLSLFVAGETPPESATTLTHDYFDYKANQQRKTDYEINLKTFYQSQKNGKQRKIRIVLERVVWQPHGLQYHDGMPGWKLQERGIQADEDGLPIPPRIQ